MREDDDVVGQILQACRMLHARNLLAAADGNVSFRLPGGRVLITPAGQSKALLKGEDLAVVDLEGRGISGTPSTELPMHLEVYRRCERARCVVHAHPPTAIAWSIARPTLAVLPDESMPESILAVGSIPIVPYARPGTGAMASALAPYLPSSRVMVLARHGALSWGENVREAYNGMERIEHVAQILKLAEELGGLTPLPAAELEALRGLKAARGEQSL